MSDETTDRASRIDADLIQFRSEVDQKVAEIQSELRAINGSVMVLAGVLSLVLWYVSRGRKAPSVSVS